MSKEFDEKIKLCLAKDKRTPEEEGLLTIEFSKCMGSFLHFLKWVKLIETPTLDNPGGAISLELWPHLKEVVRTLLTKRFITVLKARQIGLSYITAAYVLWHSLSHVGSTVLLFASREDDAFLLLGKCYEMYGQLPLFLQLELGSKSKGEMSIPIMHSTIMAMPATEFAGKGHTASIIVCDEHDDHPFAFENYRSAKPTIDRSGGQFISIFTVEKKKPDTLAKALFKGALAGTNDFTPLFFPWDVVPGRDEAWYEFTKKNAPPDEVAELGIELYMSQNYPSSIEEALSRPETVAVFDKKVLNNMAEDVRSPINIDDTDIIHIYKDYHIGNFYIAGTDVSLGVGRDYNVTCIMDVKTGDIVADILSQYLAPEELALHSVEMLKRYHNPLWWIEENMWGRTVIAKAQELGYKRLGYRDEKQTKIGFVTEDKSRTDLFGALIPAINDYQIKIYSQQGLKQFYGVIRNADKKGKIEAMSSQHDDYVIAVGICWLKKGDVKTSSSPMKPIETLTWDEQYPSVIQGLIDKQLQGVVND